MNPRLQPIGNAMQSLLIPYEIVLKYSQMQIGLYNYYCDIIDNKSVINFAFYILQYSCAKSIARRQKISIAKVFKKYGKLLRVSTTNGGKTYTIQLKDLKTLTNKTNNRKRNKVKQDTDPFHIMEFWRTTFKIYENCCICGATENIGMHHLNSISNIDKGKDKYQYVRQSFNRKQIPVCNDCHTKITNGTFNLGKPVEFFHSYIASL